MAKGLKRLRRTQRGRVKTSLAKTTKGGKGRIKNRISYKKSF